MEHHHFEQRLRFTQLEADPELGPPLMHAAVLSSALASGVKDIFLQLYMTLSLSLSLYIYI